MEFLETLDYWFYAPVFFWVGLYIWFYRVTYPTYLKGLVKKGIKWAYVPKIKNHYSFLDALFTLAMAVVSAVPFIWAIYNWVDLPCYYGFATTPIFVIVGFILCKISKSKAASLFQSAYFYEYRRVRYESESKGNFRSEFDVHNHTLWSFTKKLKNAEAHGRLWKYVNSMAKTKKIPPDVYAETMYV